MIQWQPGYETSPEAAEALIERLAQTVLRYGLEVPAVLFLELSKPLAFTLSSLVHAFTPFLGLYTENEEICTDFASLFSDRRLLESLICRIEALAKES